MFINNVWELKEYVCGILLIRNLLNGVISKKFSFFLMSTLLYLEHESVASKQGT
jgi:hypothetical protein